MNHPNHEQWMSFLYGEAAVEEQATLAAHLRGCEACSAQLRQWQAARNELDAWQLRPLAARPDKNPRRNMMERPFLRWAAAIALLVTGIGFGRVGQAKVDARRLRAAIEPEIRQQLRQEFEAKRIEDNRAIYAALQKIDSQRLADYVSLKKELDTVAVLTDAGGIL